MLYLQRKTWTCIVAIYTAELRSTSSSLWEQGTEVVRYGNTDSLQTASPLLQEDWSHHQHLPISPLPNAPSSKSWDKICVYCSLCFRWPYWQHLLLWFTLFSCEEATEVLKPFWIQSFKKKMVLLSAVETEIVFPALDFKGRLHVAIFSLPRV